MDKNILNSNSEKLESKFSDEKYREGYLDGYWGEDTPNEKRIKLWKQMVKEFEEVTHIKYGEA
jgi:hypothetical protein